MDKYSNSIGRLSLFDGLSYQCKRILKSEKNYIIREYCDNISNLKYLSLVRSDYFLIRVPILNQHLNRFQYNEKIKP